MRSSIRVVVAALALAAHLLVARPAQAQVVETHPGPRAGCLRCAMADAKSLARGVESWGVRSQAESEEIREVVALAERLGLEATLRDELRTLRAASDAGEPLRRWAKRVGVSDEEKWSNLKWLISDNDFTRVADRFNPSSLTELESLRRSLNDGDLLRTVDRLRISTTRDLSDLKVALARYRDPEVRKASATDKVLSLSDGKGGSATKVSDLLMRLRSGQSLPAEWSAGDKKVVVLDVADLSAIDTGRLAGKMLELVAEAAPDGDGPALVFTKDPARARQRLTRFFDYREVDFRNDEASLLKVERFGPLAKEILDDLAADKSDGPRLRFVVGHLDSDAAVLGRLVTDAKAGTFRDTHLGIFVCNDPKNWAKFLELYDAAMENGALSVTFPTRAINVPAMTLMAVTLKGNPLLIRRNAPQTAVRKAYREAHRLLSEAADASKSDVERRSHIGDAFGAKAMEFFLVDDKLHQPTIDEILRALETDGVRMVPLARNSSPSTGSATASLNHGKHGDVG